LGIIIGNQFVRIGADLTQAESRASVPDEVIAKLNQKEKGTAMVEVVLSHLRTEKLIFWKSCSMAKYLRPVKLFHCWRNIVSPEIILSTRMFQLESAKKRSH
jgi:hypothetical protein